MMAAKNNSKFYTHLFKPVEVAKIVKDEYIADEGALLCMVRLRNTKTFSETVGRYVSKCRCLGIVTVVFDQCTPSTKDVTRDSTYRSANLVTAVSMN